MAIFSEKDGKAILIDAFGAGHYYARVCADGTILTLSVGGISYEKIRVNRILNQQLYCAEFCVMERDDDGEVHYSDKNGAILSESDYRAFEERWEQAEGESDWLISKGFSIVYGG